MAPADTMDHSSIKLPWSIFTDESVIFRSLEGNGEFNSDDSKRNPTTATNGLPLVDESADNRLGIDHDVQLPSRLGSEKTPSVDDENQTLESKFHETIRKSSFSNFNIPFCLKLHEMLKIVEREGQSQIVSWLPHGKSFRVHKEDEFVAFILPSYFNQTKFTSFTRQLYMYNFQKVQHGPDQGAFYHEKFRRDDKTLCQSIRRKKDKKLPSTARKNPASPLLESSEGMLCTIAGLKGVTENDGDSSKGRSPPSSLVGQDLGVVRHAGPNEKCDSTKVIPRSLQANVRSGTKGKLRTIQGSTLPSTLAEPVDGGEASMPVDNLSLPAAATQLFLAEGNAVLTNVPQNLVEEDWLSKYEQLNNMSTRLGSSVFQSLSLLPTACSAVNSAPLLDKNGKMTNNEKLHSTSSLKRVSNSFRTNSTSTTKTMQHLIGTTDPWPHLVMDKDAFLSTERARYSKVEDHYVHATKTSDSNRNYSQDDSETYKDGDQVDFEGRTFYFVSSFST